MIRSRELSPVVLVEACIREIEKLNPGLNAVVVSRFREAKEEALRAEAQLADPLFTPPSLFGIPFTVKEAISVKGYPSTFGSYRRRNNTAKRTAPVVENLLKEGAIIVGFDNTPENCFWMECDNKIYGRTLNPYNASRTPGGSSGGSGAIVGSGAVPFSIGSDIAGSIRMPSAFCGVWGHCPSGGIIPIDGHYPYDFTGDTEDHDVSPFVGSLKVGPMARYASDVHILFYLMQGKALPAQMLPPELKKLRVYVLPNPTIKYVRSCTNEVQEEVKKIAQLLEQGETS